jgi:hypothetical protein
MEGFDRRKFLKGSSVAVGLAGAMTVVPGAIPALAKPSQGASSSSMLHQEEEISQPFENVDSGDVVVAHIRDASKGQIDLFVGTSHFTLKDKGLTNRILSAAR